jgi:hypothetical protein
MPDRITKRERAALRELAAEAYERELDDALSELYDEFRTWDGKSMSAFDLNEKIHQFHNGLSRELYSIYVMNDPEIAVVIGVVRSVINLDAIEETLREKLRPTIESIARTNDHENDAAT